MGPPAAAGHGTDTAQSATGTVTLPVGHCQCIPYYRRSLSIRLIMIFGDSVRTKNSNEHLPPACLPVATGARY